MECIEFKAVMGFDISKPAVMAASKRSKTVSWAVGNNKKMPVQTGSVQVLLSLFGFPVWSEFQRVLAPGGQLIVVDTGPAHLMELRRELYADVKVKEVAVHPDLEAHFTTVNEVVLRYEVEVNSGEAVRDLIAMTPHAYRASGERVEAVVAQGRRTVTVDVRLTVCAPR